MNFLAPLFLFGVLFIAGPIIFHLIRHVPRKRVVFSSTEFLDETEPKTEKARKLQNPWLLIIRCLIVALLTFAFARPFFPENDDLGDSSSVRNNIVIAIDQSASMGRIGIQSELETEFNAIISELKNSDGLSVFGFSDTIKSVLSSEEWNALPSSNKPQIARSRLAEIEPLSRSASLTIALEEAVSLAEAMQEDSAQTSFATIYVLSDFAKGTDTSNIDSIEWPQYLELVRKPLATSPTKPNLGLSWEGWLAPEDGPLVANLAVSSSHPEQSIAAQIEVTTATGQEVGQSVSLILEQKTKHLVQIEIPEPFSAEQLRFKLSGDEHTFDNTLPVSPSYTPTVSVSILSDSELLDPQGAPYFMQKALRGLEAPKAQVLFNTSSQANFDAYLIDRALSQTETGEIRKQIESGRHALVTVQSIEMLETLNSLSGSQSWSVDQSSGESLLIGEVDFKHPLFSPFSDSRFSNFSNIQVWEPLQLIEPNDLPVNVLSRYDNGSALLSELSIGEGTLWIWAGSWAPQKSQWVLSSKFVPFMHQVLLQATGGPSLSSNTILTAQTVSNYQSLFNLPITSEVGFAETASGTRSISFQLPPKESETAPFTLDEWDQLGIPELDSNQRQDAITALAVSSQKESREETEQRQKVWQWVLWLVLALLAFESALAIAVTKRKEAAAV